MIFRDRAEAGRTLADKLRRYAGRSDVVVLGLSRGGIVVAAEVARGLAAPLDAFTVRKLGVPGAQDRPFGAVATGGVRVLNDDVIELLKLSDDAITKVVEREWQELARRDARYRRGQPKLDLRGRSVILVDDGLATGASMRAAIQAVRQLGPRKVVVAVPVAAPETCADVRSEADEAFCAWTPEPFVGVRRWYNDFPQTTDEEVVALLDVARRPHEMATRTGTKRDRAESEGPRAHGVPADARSNSWGSSVPASLTPNASAGGARAAGDRMRAQIVDAIRRYGLKLRGDSRDYDGLVQQICGARLVLVGDSTHGTHEFYKERAALTKRLIEEQGFRGVAVEADWPDAYRVNRYVRGESDDRSAAEALGDFTRFPAWMWRNADVIDFVEWLRSYNDRLTKAQPKVGFYGLDLYSLSASMHAVIGYLETIDPEAARRARYRYSCFDHFGEDSQSYGYAAQFDLDESCEKQVVAQLTDLRRQAAEHPGAAPLDADERFFAEQNARVVKSAEAYYRAMFRDRAGSWNLRDRHMVETLQSLIAHLDRQAAKSRLVLWAHNSHLGDARATDMGSAGELNVGELVRRKFRHQSVLIGMTTYQGTVTAASDWGAAAEWKMVRPALRESYEAIFHGTGIPGLILSFTDPNEAVVQLRARRLQRAIGVIYRPETERLSHYFEASLPEQFDVVIHLDETRAVVPMERTTAWRGQDLPETFPEAV